MTHKLDTTDKMCDKDQMMLTEFFKNSVTRKEKETIYVHATFKAYEHSDHVRRTCKSCRKDLAINHPGSYCTSCYTQYKATYYRKR